MKSRSMYASSTASTTTSGSRVQTSVPSERRVRVIRLLRPRRPLPAFGFAIRGGKEHVTGFFVSKVDFHSEAHIQGLKVGDQLVSVNGFRVDDAVHSELANYISTQTRLKIKVRNVGMIPFKDKSNEPLTWQYVSEHASINSDTSSSPTLCHDTERMSDMRLSILVPPRAKLGCGICKGPEWKLGIFVQFVREGGIAKEAGLRPGDQILSCNGTDFSNISFNEAIAAMKITGRLELVIREGAGIELVSPESSGYNSSASSAAGERSPAPPTPLVPLAPPAALRRRLASVAEEAADRADRLTSSRFKRRTWGNLDFDWKNDDIHNFDTPSDIEPDYDSPSIPNNPHSFENKHNLKNRNKNEFITSPSNRTIINLTEDGATIQCSYNNQTPRKSTFAASQTSRENDKKTIVVEVHHTNTNACGKPHCNYPPPEKNSNPETSSMTSSATLSSAIAEEIQRRKATKKKETPADNEVVKKTNLPKSIINEKNKQHDALMDEFKKVHSKMFAHQDQNHEEKHSEDNKTDRQQTVPIKKMEQSTFENLANGHVHQKRDVTDNPPPPPPMPISSNINDLQETLKPPPGTLTLDKLKRPIQRTSTLVRTPTPDYSSKTDSASVKNKDEKVELDSINSYSMNNPKNGQPKPPANYFVKAPNSTTTMKRHVKNVSVTIGEYGNKDGTLRREPSKMDFLSGDKVDGRRVDEELSITNRLQSELALTLSRSNLRKNTEVIDSVSFERTMDSDTSLNKNFHVRYGNNILPLPPTITIPKVTKIKY